MNEVRKHEPLEFDMDILECYKIRIRVELINSIENLNEYIDSLNAIFPKIKIDSKVFPLKFRNNDSGASKILYESHKKNFGLLSIYDSSLNDKEMSENEICDLYKESRKIKSKKPSFNIKTSVV